MCSRRKVFNLEPCLRPVAAHRQNPQCEGEHRERTLFNEKLPSVQRQYVVNTLGQEYFMDAGAAKGISPGTVFFIYATEDGRFNDRPLGKLVASKVGPEITNLTLIESEPPFNIPRVAYAVKASTGNDEDLRLSVKGDQTLMPVCLEVIEDSLKDNRPWTIRMEPSDSADLVLSVEPSEGEEGGLPSGQSTIFFDNTRSAMYGLKRMPLAYLSEKDRLAPILRSAAHWFWHLRRTSDEDGVLRRLVDIEFFELHRTGYDDEAYPILGHLNDENLIKESRIDLVVDEAKMYGIKLTNKSKGRLLYPHVFYFDSSDFSIGRWSPHTLMTQFSWVLTSLAASYYQISVAKMETECPLLPQSSLPVGYGSGGARPFTYFLRKNQDIDVGFLKIFITSFPVNLDYIRQENPFSDHRSMEQRALPLELQWDTILIPIVQVRSAEARARLLLSNLTV